MSEQARANSTKTIKRGLSKCFTIMCQKKVNSYEAQKIAIQYYQTNYLKTTATEIKENDENEAAHQMLKIPRVGDWENRVREKSTSTNTISRLGTKNSGKKKGAR